ncbi:hypothetical protein CRUP_020921, partial [Coryphaenoides rupestris]
MQIRGTRKTSPGLGARRAADSSGEDSLSGPSITSTTERLVPQGGTGPSVRDPTPRRSSGDPSQQSVWFTRSSSTSSTTCCCCCWTGSEGNLPARKRGPEAVKKGNTKELHSLLQNMTNCEVNVNSFGPEGQTALHQSVIDGNLELVKLLVKFGADIRLANREGWSALHIAAFGGHQDIVLYLITKAKYSSGARDDETLDFRECFRSSIMFGPSEPPVNAGPADGDGDNVARV